MLCNNEELFKVNIDLALFCHSLRVFTVIRSIFILEKMVGAFSGYTTEWEAISNKTFIHI